MSIVTLLHVITGLAIVIYTGDILRQLIGHKHLLTVVACALVCIGAFGEVCHSIQYGASFYELALSAGVALYCALRHRAQLTEPRYPAPNLPPPFDSQTPDKG